MGFKILNTIAEFTPKAKEILESFAIVDYRLPSQKEFSEIVGEYDLVFVGLGLKIDKEVLDNAGKLKAIATATTGLDHIDTEYAKEKGIAILSLRGETKFLDTISGTAELAFGLLLSLVRYIPNSSEDVKNGKWNRDAFRGRVLLNKTLGIVGLGRLGKWMAKYGEGFGMKIVFFDPNIKKSPNKKWKKVSFEKLLTSSDIVSVHVHLSEETEDMFNKEVFGKMKPTAYLINTSRGKIVNEKDIISALMDKKIAGYGTDVLSGELQFSENNFHNYPLVDYARGVNNVLIVPHIGGMTYESREATDIFMSNKIKKFLKKYE